MTEILNIKKVQNFLENAKAEDLEGLLISDSQLQSIRKNANAIYKMKLSQVITIQEHIKKVNWKEKIDHKVRYSNEIRKAQTADENMPSKDVRYVGIDIGTTNFINASDPTLTHVFNFNTVLIKRAMDSLKREMMNIDNLYIEDKEPVIQAAYDRFSERIERTVDLSLRNLMKYYPDGTTYVIGRPDPGKSEPQFHYLLNEITKHLERLASTNACKVYNGNENYTSHLCPECGYGSKDNRTADNTFECVSCGFTHRNDDAVAACNIIRKFIRKNDL